MLPRHLIGTESAPTVYDVEWSQVRRFAAAIGDTSALFTAPAAAAESRWGGPIAPPTFPISFPAAPIPGLNLPSGGLIHGEQRFSYHTAFRPGDRITVRARLADLYDRPGRTGMLIFAVIEVNAVNQHGQCCYDASSTIILRGPVAEEWLKGVSQ